MGSYLLSTLDPTAVASGLGPDAAVEEVENVAPLELVDSYDDLVDSSS